VTAPDTAIDLTELLGEAVELLRSLSTRQQAVVGVTGAAYLLNTSEDQVRNLVHAGLLATVPNLSAPRKLSIAVAEIDRFASVNVGAMRLAAAS
jgi:hypothetical protein